LQKSLNNNQFTGVFSGNSLKLLLEHTPCPSESPAGNFGGKEMSQVDRKLNQYFSCLSGIAFLALILVLASSGPCFSQDDCASSRAKWDRVSQDLRGKLQDFISVQQAPVERIIQKPVVERV